MERGGYDEADFCRRIDDELFSRIDGSPIDGPGGYTSQSIRDARHKPVEQRLPWGRVGGHADTIEAIERALAIAVRYAGDPARLAATVADNTRLTQIDDTVMSMSVAFCAALGLLVQGHRLDAALSGKRMALVKSGALPFHAVTTANREAPRAGEAEPSGVGRFASPDALLTPSHMARAAVDPDIHIEPAWKVSTVSRMPCAIYHALHAP